MINIFESKSYRVKGISFHPTKPWILTSLHNGVINLYDYVNCILLHSFEDSDCPIRTIDFHFSQSIFAAGGDDFKIKIYNYQIKKIQFSLEGHTDYIRTVQFHHELPWLISASDDQTIRIWNWQNRTLLTTATGHDHYVMSAFFHPTNSLIVSASLDQSIRIWDYSNLKNKFYKAKQVGLQVIELDVVLKHKLDGHERGVNWAVFHPTFNLIASGSDDKTARIWKYSDTRWDEVDCFREHSNNVSCVLFHKTQDFLITNSEDKSFKVWDLSKKKSIFTDKKENDRYWIISSHPTNNLFGFGSDNGIAIYLLEKIKVPSCLLSKDQALFFSNNNGSINILKENVTSTTLVKESKEAFKSVKPFKSQVKFIHANPFLTGNSNILNFGVLINSIAYPEKSNLVHFILKAENSFKSFNGNETSIECSSFSFLSKGKLAYITSNSNCLFICDITNTSNVAALDVSSIFIETMESIHQATQGKLIIKFLNGLLCLFDINTKKITQEINEMSDFNYIVWNINMSYAAIVGKHNILIVNKNLEICHRIKENSPIKAVKFDENNVLFYSTYFQIKYSLINGLNGIIKSTDMTYYLMLISNGVIYYSDLNKNRSSFKFNYTEVRFNIALMNKNYDEVSSILKSGQVSGVKIIEDLKNSGFPDLSLKYVTDPKQKFILAVQSGKLEVALEVADQLKSKLYYNKLAEKAMKIGSLNLVEYCYVKAKNLDKLMFFYFISGKFEKLKKLEDLLKDKGELSRKFINTLYTSNHEEKIKILINSGYNALALLVSKLHKNKSATQQLLNKVDNFDHTEFNSLKEQVCPVVQLKTVISNKNSDYHSNWVLATETRKKSVTQEMDNLISNENYDNSLNEFSNEKMSLNNNIDMFSNKSKNEELKTLPKSKKVTSKWDDDNDEEEDYEENNDDLNENNSVSALEQINTINKTVLIEDKYKDIYKNSDIIGIQALLGNFSNLSNLLNNQLAINDISEFKSILKNICLSSYTQIRLATCASSINAKIKPYINSEFNNYLPCNGISKDRIDRLLEEAYDLIENKEMEKAFELFSQILKLSIFFICHKSEDIEYIKDIFKTCGEYLLMIKLNQKADISKDDKFNYSQICLLITACKLSRPLHNYLMLKRAKVAVKNAKNYVTASTLVQKMLELVPKLKDYEDLGFEKLVPEYNTIKSRSNDKDYKFTIKDFDGKLGNDVIDCKNLEFIIHNNKITKCTVCNASHIGDDIKRSKCNLCNLTVLGKEVIGFKFKDNE